MGNNSIISFEDKLEQFIEYMNCFILQLKIPSADIVKFKEYENVKSLLNSSSSSKNIRRFCKFYNECVLFYNEKLKKIFKDEYNIHSYCYYMISSLIVEYLNIYLNKILDVFWNFIVINDDKLFEKNNV